LEDRAEVGTAGVTTGVAVEAVKGGCLEAVFVVVETNGPLETTGLIQPLDHTWLSS
jgi:hypothetical protein